MKDQDPIDEAGEPESQRADHPNHWSQDHPQGQCECRVCPDCFRPRRPEQWDGDCDVCDVCRQKGA